MASKDRFKALVHYIIWKCRDNLGQLGGVKLNKALWYIDTYAYRLWGRSISGETAYIKRQLGPVPRRILATLEELEKEGCIVVQRSNYYGYPKKDFICKKDPDFSVFTKQELNIINEIVETIGNEYTAAAISELSHDVIWRSFNLGEEIPIYAVLGFFEGEITNEHIEWANAQIKEVRG